MENLETGEITSERIGDFSFEDLEAARKKNSNISQQVYEDDNQKRGDCCGTCVPNEIYWNEDNDCCRIDFCPWSLGFLIVICLLSCLAFSKKIQDISFIR